MRGDQETLPKSILSSLREAKLSGLWLGLPMESPGLSNGKCCLLVVFL